MAEKNYWTQEMTDAENIARTKDAILREINSHSSYNQYSLISALQLTPVQVDDYLKLLLKEGLLVKPGLHGQSPFISLTPRGKEFLAGGGYFQKWSEETEREYKRRKEADEKEQALIERENQKLKLEKDKVNISKWALGVSIIAILISAYSAFGPEPQISEINSRIDSIENGIEKMAREVHKEKLDTILKE